MARIMGQAGHKVIVVNRGFDVMTVLTGFSRYVSKFYMVPLKEVYECQLEKIWRDEDVDWFIPMNLSLDDIKFNIVMNFKAIDKPIKYSTLAINHVYMAETLQNRTEFLRKCQDLQLPTVLDLHPELKALEEYEKDGIKYGANVICKNGNIYLLQVSNSRSWTKLYSSPFLPFCRFGSVVKLSGPSLSNIKVL